MNYANQDFHDVSEDKRKGAMPSQEGTEDLSIYAQAVKLGCQIDNHESDLYVKADEAGEKLVSWCILVHPEEYLSMTRFRSKVDKQEWMDFPFAFDPFWTKKLRHTRPTE